MSKKKISIVSSFNNSFILKDIFLSSFSRYLTPDIDINIFSEDQLSLPERFNLYHLNDEEDYNDLQQINHTPLTYFKYDYQKDIKRFSHKVFSITSKSIRHQYDWLVWIDGDVEATDHVDFSFMSSILDTNYMVIYLGRIDMNHSECGFVAYNLKRNATKFLDDFRDMYTSYKILFFPELHDSYIFDRVREQYDDKDFLNLSYGIKGDHVWPKTILGTKMIHHKGEEQKIYRFFKENEKNNYFKNSKENRASIRSMKRQIKIYFNT